MAGGVIRHVPALTPEEYLAGVSRAVKHSVPPPIVLIVSYPSNPTAQWVDLDFYRRPCALAKKHDLLVLSDVAYSEIYFDDNPPPSILQVEGAQGHRGGGQHACPRPTPWPAGASAWWSATRACARPWRG